MGKDKQKIAVIILTFFCAFFLLGANTTFAQGLELTYPKIGGLELKPDSSIQEYVRYFYVLLISFTGAIALISIIWGGVYWLTSSGDSGKINEGRKRITAGLTGAILILSSHLILTLINPDLTTITLTKAPPVALKTAADLRGIIICRESVNPNTREELFDEINNENCLERDGITPVPQGYKGENFRIRKVPGDNSNYYIIMTDRSLTKGSSAVFNKCSIITIDYANNEIFKGSLQKKDVAYIMIGNYSAERAAINFCYTDDLSCDTGPVWEKIANGGEFINFENENKLEPEEVQIARNPDELMSPVRWTRTTSDINYIVLSDEKELDGKCYITNTQDTDLWSSFGTPDNFDLRDSNNVQQNKYFQSTYSNIGSMIVFPWHNFSVSSDYNSDNTSEEARVRGLLERNSNVSINKNCSDFTKGFNEITGGQTCVQGLPQLAIDGVRLLSQFCSDSSISITGGTEKGHQTHGPGKPTLDFSASNPNLNNCIYNSGCQSCRDKWDNCRCTATMTDRGNNLIMSVLAEKANGPQPQHWHINFTQATTSN